MNYYNSVGDTLEENARVLRRKVAPTGRPIAPSGAFFAALSVHRARIANRY